jgi:hypothetical protein
LAPRIKLACELSFLQISGGVMKREPSSR